MRRARATTPLAALLIVLLSGCAAASTSAEADRIDGAAVAESDRAPVEVEPTVAFDGDVARVAVDDAVWRIEVLDAGPVEATDIAMFDGSPSVTLPSGGDQVGWVCVHATQLSGEDGAWMSDALRFEVWATDEGPRYDDLTGFDYEPAGPALDVYEASGNPLGEPYERVCPIFVVPADVDFSTIAIVPNGGEPAVLER